MATTKTQREELLKQLAVFKETHGDEFGLRTLGVFGSFATDDASDSSDVDIVVEVDRPNLLLMVHLKDALEAFLHRPVDLVRYRKTMNAFLKREIDERAIYV